MVHVSQRVSMPGLKDHSLLLLAVGMVMANRALIRLGLRKRGDGWRRGAGLVLREQSAEFILSALALNVSAADPTAAQELITRRLAEFFAAETSTHIRLRHGAACVVESIDRPGYALTFLPWVEGPARFVPPDSWANSPDHRELLLKVVARITPDGSAADLWFRANHVGIDGVPLQEILSRLETRWGTHELVYPSTESFAPHETVRPCAAGRPGIGEIQLFLDFSPLLAWRKKVNQDLQDPMTVSAALLWRLARHPAFAGLHMGTTVDVPATADGIGRGVGLVVIRPADYFHQPDGIVRYVRDFNAELVRIKSRTSKSFKILDAAAHLPPSLSRQLLRRALEGQRAFGSFGLSLIKEGKVFGAPIGDTGQPYGFMAIGSVTLPASDGKRLGCIMVKGPIEKITPYPDILREALSTCIDP